MAPCRTLALRSLSPLLARTARLPSARLPSPPLLPSPIASRGAPGQGRGTGGREVGMSAVGVSGSEANAGKGAVKVALCQMNVTPDKEENIATAVEQIGEAAAQGAKMVVLPEMWNCPYANASFPIYAETIEAPPRHAPSPAKMQKLPEAPSKDALSRAARENGCWVVGGSIPERDNQGRLFNTCMVFDQAGELKAKYRKAHLFDIDIPGKITFKESDTLTAGARLEVVETNLGFKIGLGICYDLRFPEMAALLARRGCDVLVYPGAFNMTTGPVHWDLLQRCRAVDNQVYMLTCSPARMEDEAKTGTKYVAYGHSQAIGPFAETLCCAGAGAGIVYCEIDVAQCEERRQAMPLSKQRRQDLYDLHDCSNFVGFGLGN